MAPTKTKVRLVVEIRSKSFILCPYYLCDLVIIYICPAACSKLAMIFQAVLGNDSQFLLEVNGMWRR